MKTLIEEIAAARAVGVPLLGISTPDQFALVNAVVKGLDGGFPAIQWDRARGFTALNNTGKAALSIFTEEEMMASADPAGAMILAMRLADNPETHRSLLFALNLPRAFRGDGALGVIQAVMNLRDSYKSKGNTLIVIGPDIDLPSELKQDVILLDDPLPEDEHYAKILEDLHSASKLPKPEKEIQHKATLAVRGLSSFVSEQVLAMSMALHPKKNQSHLPSAWKLKSGAVGNVRGLTMTLEGPPLTDLKGLDQIIKDLTDLNNGPLAPQLYVRVDEIDKAFQGLGQRGEGGENTGVVQDQQNQFLVNMEENSWTGAILFGLRGAGKTVLTQAIGADRGLPTIAMDMGQMQQKYVGESQQNVRDAFRMIKAIGRNRVCVLATCNRMTVFSPEFLRRFKLGIYYFDLLTKAEREALWPIYLKKYGLPLDSPRPVDEGWTGAEIRNCCELAYALGRSLIKASEKIVPVTRSDARGLEEMRNQADGRYLSVVHDGPYRKETVTQIDTAAPRKMDLGGGDPKAN